jgi:2-C-methyl-D-erythritol 4-phosphate cytidylyltransferase
LSIAVGVVIPAAGSGTRMGGVQKAFMEIAGQPMLARTLQPILSDPRVTAVAVALDPASATAPPKWLTELDARVVIVGGGSERGDSVRRALHALPEDVDVIVVHDAARPLVSAGLIATAIDSAAAGTSVIAAAPVIDTIHETAADGRILRTPTRSVLRAAQTPQAFPAAVLREAHLQAERAGVEATDDAALVVRYVGPVYAIEGERSNIKLTVATDVTLAEALLRERDE